jgi:hypothetical protein
MPFAELCGKEQAKSLGQLAALATTAAKGTEVVLTETRPWTKGSGLAIDMVCDTLSLVYGEIGKKLKAGIKSSAKFISAEGNYKNGNFQAACTDIGAALKTGCDIIDESPTTKASTLMVAELFSSAKTSDEIRQAYHDGRPDKIVTIFGKIGVSARKIYLENLKHEAPEEGEPPLTAEQKSFNKTIDVQIKGAEAYGEYAEAPEKLVENVRKVEAGWKAGKPKAVLMALMDMGLTAAKGTLALLKQSEPEDVDESTLTEAERLARAEIVSHNQTIEELLSLIEDTERVVHLVDELDSVAAGWTKYQETRDPNVLTAMLQKFGKEVFSAHLERQRHEEPEPPAELTKKQEAENKKLDELLARYTGVADIIGGGVQVTTGARDIDSGAVTEGMGRMLSGQLQVAQGLGSDTEDAQLAVSLGSSSLQTMLAIAQGKGSNAVKGFEAVLENSDAAKARVLEKLKDDENEKLIEKIDEAELVESSLKESITSALGIDSPSSETLALQLSELEALETEGLTQRVEAEREDFRAELELSIGGSDPEQDSRTRLAVAASFDIDTLIKKLERDKLILDAALQLSESIASLGTGVVPGLKTMTAVKGLMVSVGEAMVRRAEYYKFLENLESAEVSMSPYAPAIRKRVEDSLQQYSDAQLKSVINLCNVYGSTLGGVVGAIEQACVTLSGSDKLTEAYTDQDKQQAWSIYQAALKDKSNRKLKIRALQLNPTLGKYALAYGAKAGDPIARSFMKCCGLDEQTLASPKANVDKVVKYLGLYFNEEVVTSGMELPQQWAQGHTIELTPRSWTTLTRKAVKSASLKTGGDEQIVRILLETDGHEFLSSDAPAQHIVQNYVAILKRLQWAFDNYAPLNTSAQAHTDMGEIAKQYSTLAQRKQALAAVAL